MNRNLQQKEFSMDCDTREFIEFNAIVILFSLLVAMACYVFA